MNRRDRSVSFLSSPIRSGTNSDFEEGGGRPPIDCTTPMLDGRRRPNAGHLVRRMPSDGSTPRSVCARPDSHSTVITTGAPPPRIPHVIPTLFPFLLRFSALFLLCYHRRFLMHPPLTCPLRFTPERPLNRGILKNTFNSCVSSRRVYRFASFFARCFHSDDCLRSRTGRFH